MFKLSRNEKVNALAVALWGTDLRKDVRDIANSVEAEMDRLGFEIIKRRHDKKGLAQ